MKALAEGRASLTQHNWTADGTFDGISYLAKTYPDIDPGIGRTSRPTEWRLASPEISVASRNRDQSVVMLSLEEFESQEETAHLLRSPVNAKRLLASIANLEGGKGRSRKVDLES